MSEFIVYAKRGRMIMLAFLSILFVLIGGAFILLYFVEEDVPFWIVIIGIVVVLFFGLCLIYYIKEIIANKPVLIISKDGIMDRSSYIGAGLVRWEDIEDIDFVNFSGQLFLGIYTLDPELIINRTGQMKRLLNQLNKGLINTQVNIPVKNLKCSKEELIEQIDIHWQNISE